MKRSNWVRLIAVILIISMLAAPVSAATNRGSDGVRANGLIGTIVEIIRDIIRDIFDDWFDKPGDEEPVPTEPIETTAPTAPGETEPTEPGETKPTTPGETKPTEPGETEPDEPELNEPPQSPDNDLELIEGHANTANGHLLRGVTYSLANIIAQQGEPLTTATANRFGTKLGNSLGGNAISTSLKTMASKGGVQTMASNGGIQTMAEVDITDGLVAHYDFETVNGTTVTNNVTTNTTTTATLNNTTVEENDHMGNAIRLNGGGLQLTNVVNATTSSFSVSLWYKASNNAHYNLVQAGTIGGSTGRTILLLNSSNQYFTYLTGDDARVKTDTVDRSVWQHITFSYDKDANKAYFFINGVADNADGVTLSGSPLDTADMIIGRHRTDSDPFNGLVDEVRVYNKVLSAEEAAAVYNYGSTDPEEPSEPEQPVVDPADDSRDIPVSVLTATDGNHEDSSETEGGAKLALDGNQNTMWHTEWDGSDRSLHWIQFQLNADYKVDGLRYQPRQDSSINGLVTEYEIQISDDGQTFTSVATGTWSYSDRSWKIATFDAVNTKYVRLVVKNAQSDKASLFASAAEIRLTGEEIETTPVEPEQPAIGSEVVFFPVTMFNYNNGISELNDDDIMRTLTHQAEVEAGLKEKWEGLYFSGGKPSPTSYTYTTEAASHSDLSWQQVMDGTYYADEACTEQVSVVQKGQSDGGYSEVTVTAGELWTNAGGVDADTFYLTSYYHYTSVNGAASEYYPVYIKYYDSTNDYEVAYLVNGKYLMIDAGANHYPTADETVSLYAKAGITGYTLVAGGNTLATLDGTDLTAKVGVPLYTAAGEVTVNKSYAEWNWWAYETSGDAARNMFYAGLVQDELVDGELKFNVAEPGIFTFDSAHPEITNDGIKDIYQHVGLPFVKNAKGYYTFDSDANGTYFADTTGDGKSDPWYGAEDDFFNMYLDYGVTQGWENMYYGDGSTNLWAPYNTNANDTGEGAIDYHFGMRADIPFSMTPNGRIKSNDDNSEPITFTFKGDDDVWIFIDGHLVIDLGGIHNRLGATIDFANNTITYFKPESNTNTNEFGAYNVEDFELVQKLYSDADGEGALGQTRANFSTVVDHEMSIFYLERGKGTSNCQIEFNLPMLDTVLVTKDITHSWSAAADERDGEDGDGTERLTAKEQAAVDKLDFDFKLWKKEIGGRYTAVANTNYYLLDKADNILGIFTTGADGTFSLKNGQTAMFMTDLGNGGVTYAVEELNLDLDTFLTPDYKFAGLATNGFDFYGETLNNDTEDENDTKPVSEHLDDASLIGEQELPMDAVQLVSYDVTPYGSIEAIESLEFICTNYLNAELPSPTARAYEDIIVIDYGLPVQVDPLHNDLFRGENIEIVAWGDETLELNEVLDEKGFAIDDQTSWTGNKFFSNTTTEAQVFDSGNVTFSDVTYAEHAHDITNADGTTTTTYTYTRDSFEYELTEQLTEVEEIRYIIKVDSTVEEEIGNETVTKTACRYALGKVYIVPATIMYYEENFDGLVSYATETGSLVGEQRVEAYVSPYQEPGVVGTVGDSTYGSDVAYLNDPHDSNGTSFKLDTTNGYVRFAYSFTGTGTSFFARTSGTTGYMQVMLFDGEMTVDEAVAAARAAEQKDIWYRDTFYNDKNNTDLDGESLYNIPVYTNNDLDYGTYTILVTVAQAGTPGAGPNLERSGNEFYLDGIRIMQPLNESADEMLTEKALNAYAADGESNLVVATLRQKLITDVKDGEAVWNGENFVVLTDTNGAIIAAQDYISYGPKEEVYLAPGQKVTFSMKYWEPQGLKLYMGMKAPFGTVGTDDIGSYSAKLNVGKNSFTLRNATDCYYDVTDMQEKLEAVYIQAEDANGYLLFTDAVGNEIYMNESGEFRYRNNNELYTGEDELTPINTTEVDYYVITYTFEATESIVALTNIKVVGNFEFTIVEKNEETQEGGGTAET